jgi:hypothetical protein
MRSLRRGSILFLFLGILSIIAAWLAVIAQYREKVQGHRLAWGIDGNEPRFSLVSLVYSPDMSLNAVAFYILAAAFAVPGLLGLYVTRRRRAVD